MLIDNYYRLDTVGNPDDPNPFDTTERLFGHEVGHALSLLHGNGADDDNDTFLDNDDDQAAGLPRFDGPNLLQYRNGDEITVAQAEQMRAHIVLTILGGSIQPFSDSIAAGAPLDEEIKSILQYGYDDLTELELKSLLQFESASVLQYGMDYTGALPTDETTLHTSLSALPWYASIRPDTRYYQYLDLDTNDATGAYPADFANPSDPGFNKDVPRPFQLQLDDPLGGTFVIDVLNSQGATTSSPSGNYDLKSKKDWLTIALPFRLTPDTTVSFTAGGGQTQSDIPVDPESNYQPAGAKYGFDLNETAAATALCSDPSTPVNSLATPELEVQLFLGDGLVEVVGIVLVGPNPADWTRLDQREWKLLP